MGPVGTYAMWTSCAKTNGAMAFDATPDNGPHGPHCGQRSTSSTRRRRHRRERACGTSASFDGCVGRTRRDAGGAGSEASILTAL
jgi:hypothetical protein